VAAPRITRDELKQRLDAGASIIIVDARLKYPYEHSSLKLPGALRVIGDDPLPAIPAGSDVVVYDSDPNELASSHVAARFIRSGVRAFALRGGIVDWVAGNLPVETKDAPRPATPEAGALKS
jgi:rhodanese-related sulfurtransferase